MKQEGTMAAKLNMRATQESQKRPSLVEDAYKALKEAIRDNVFPPGYQGSEQEIALRLGMSRTPVHEAIIRLQEDGLVRVLSKRGVIGLPARPGGHPRNLRRHHRHRGHGGRVACRLCLTRNGTSLPTNSRRRRQQMEQALREDDLLTWATADDLFHRTLVERCGNSRIRRIAQTVTDQAHRARMITLKLRSKPTGSIAAHRGIIAAIRKGSVAEAHRHARQHRLGARDELVPLIVSFGIKHL